MMIKKYLIIVSIIFSMAIGNYNQGLSISESDNTDAMFYNPAGLAIDHGSQFDFFANHHKDSTLYK